VNSSKRFSDGMFDHRGKELKHAKELLLAEIRTRIITEFPYKILWGCRTCG